ncbi:oxidoreductase [Longibacter salinarum]|uniref:Oxidoreductase n=1 Tax=Longibacter salinarum TaxID=1850348 RepID=A0A2A8CVA2_9BACT|nr:SDR family oxidoreductase [Longibacter salinarum]PEN12533.1 oxidoreductase [Longibacter salinarum]
MSDLSGKSAIVTGASSGIGEATARRLAAEGAGIALAARRTDRLEDLQAEIEADGGEAIVVATDVTDREQVQALADATLAAFGSIDILINNAGVMPLSFIKNLHEDEWEQMVDVNVKGVLHCVGAVLPTMLEQESGHIVNVSSTAGRRLFPGGAVYCGTKHFVRALSEGMRKELAPHHNIRVTSIQPGAVDTELTNTITDEEVIEMFEERHSGIEPLESDDIAESILYVVTAPDRVDVEELMVLPSDQRT